MVNLVRILDDTLFSYSASFTTLDPQLTALPDGRFIVVASALDNSGDWDVVAGRVGVDPSFGVNQNLFIPAGGFLGDTVDATQPSVDTLPSGTTVYAWTDTSTTTGDSEIRARFFNSDGTATAPFLVNVGDTIGDQVRPEAAVLASGTAVVFAWVDLADFQIKAAVFNASGGAVSTNLTVSQTEATNQNGLPDLGLTALANGQFVVSWTDDSNNSYLRVGSSGGFFTPQIVLPGAYWTDVASLEDGRFVVTYYRSGNHYAQVFDGFGNLSVAEFHLASAVGFHAVAGLPDGRFMFAYASGGEIWAGVWNGDGTQSSDVFKVNSGGGGGRDRPHLEALADGTVAVSWLQNGNDVYFAIVDPRATGVNIGGTTGADTYTGSRFDDLFLLGDGNDVVSAGDGHDELYGGRGSDRLFGGAGNDVIEGGFGSDTLEGNQGFDILNGGGGSDLARLSGLNGAGHGLIRTGATVYALDRKDASFDTILDVENYEDAFQAISLAQVEDFHPQTYAASYNDLALAFRTNADAALSHYLNVGFREGRDVDFDVAQYLANYGDLAAVFAGDLASALNHFLSSGVDERRLPNDPLDYIASFADLIGAFDGLSLGQTIAAGLSHYHSAGFAENRRADLDFNVFQYLANYADVQAAFGTNDNMAAWHFINSGHGEGRLWEDPLEYVASFGDLIGAFGGGSAAQIRSNGLMHFQAAGFSEGRRAGIGFDADQYLANYADLRAAFANGAGGYNEAAATLHFIQAGFGEGRTDDVLMA